MVRLASVVRVGQSNFTKLATPPLRIAAFSLGGGCEDIDIGSESS
jgi:hypothetical protein